MVIRTAKFSEHKTICAIAKQHKFTKDFSNMIFSGEDCYEAERIRVAVNKGVIVGFTCFRKRIRDQVTVLYFIAVDKEAGSGLGRSLMEDLERKAGGVVELKVNKKNPAVAFYQHLGYEENGDCYNGEGLRFTKGVPIGPAKTPKAHGEAPRSSSGKRK